jgi:hypothetical protein
MKQISESGIEPLAHKVDSVKCRKRDLVIRIANWSRDWDEPGYDVEVYIGGIYSQYESSCFTKWGCDTVAAAKKEAIKFAQEQIERLL